MPTENETRVAVLDLAKTCGPIGLQRQGIALVQAPARTGIEAHGANRIERESDARVRVKQVQYERFNLPPEGPPGQSLGPRSPEVVVASKVNWTEVVGGDEGGSVRRVWPLGDGNGSGAAP